MKKLIILLLSVTVLLIGLVEVAAAQKGASVFILNTEHIEKGQFDLGNISGKTVAFLPFRKIEGGYVDDQVIEANICQKWARDMPHLNVLTPKQLADKIKSDYDKKSLGQYEWIMKKYDSRGILSSNDLKVFEKTEVDYIACISLNGMKERLTNKYMSLLSMQVYDANSGKMVWDVTKQGTMFVGQDNADDYQAVLTEKLSAVVMNELTEKNLKVLVELMANIN